MWWGTKAKVVTDEKRIDAILSRGVIVDILPSKDAFRQALLSGKRLRFYIGADPTSTALHLSHAKNYLLLEDFRKLGHEVIVLFGTFTARIGDPSERDDARPQLSLDDVQKNILQWKRQISPLISFDGKNSARIEYNHVWLEKLSMEDVIDLASNLTVQHMLERDMFVRRMKAEKPVYLHEFLYPLMQGYDSVAMDVDVEVGGTDQTFNMLVGRTLLKKLKNKEKFVVAVHLMANPLTGELMSKSQGTGVFLDSSPSEMFGAIMAQPDEMTKVFLINNTRIPLAEIDSIAALAPMEAKQRAAKEVVSVFYGSQAAVQAEEHFNNVFGSSAIPKDPPTVCAAHEARLGNILLEQGVVSSKSDFRRLVDEGAITHMEKGNKIKDANAFAEGGTYRIGKHRFIKITVR